MDLTELDRYITEEEYLVESVHEWKKEDDKFSYICQNCGYEEFDFGAPDTGKFVYVSVSLVDDMFKLGMKSRFVSCEEYLMIKIMFS